MVLDLLELKKYVLETKNVNLQGKVVVGHD